MSALLSGCHSAALQIEEQNFVIQNITIEFFYARIVTPMNGWI